MATQRISSKQSKPEYIVTTMSANATIGGTPTVPIFDSTVVSAGTKLTRVNNTVVVGEGVSRVRVSYVLMADTAATAAYLFSRIRKNGTDITQAIDNASSAGFRCTQESRIIPVAQGDVLALTVDSGGGTFVLTAARGPYFCVEVVE